MPARTLATPTGGLAKDVDLASKDLHKNADRRVERNATLYFVGTFLPVTSEASVYQIPRPGKYRASSGLLNGTGEDLWEVPSPWIESILELNELLNARA